jgi:hypothetical protein
MLTRGTNRPQTPPKRKPYHAWAFPDGTEWTTFHRSSEGYLLRFPDLVDFEVNADGKSARSWPAPGISDDTVEHLYLNQVLPLMLSRQDNLVFHASAIETEGGALAFMGLSGRGKSTLAASFATSGMRFMTDDGLLLMEQEGDYHVHPSHASLRLWQDSQEALVPANVSTGPEVQHTSKGQFIAGHEMVFCDSAQPLSCVYFLGEGTATEIEIQPAKPTEALVELMRNSFLIETEEHGALSRNFDRLARFVQLSIFYHLDYPRRYESLPLVREAILAHANETSVGR